MSKKSKIGLVVGVISIVAAITAALTAFLVVKEKQRRDDEELMEYLDCSIQ